MESDTSDEMQEREEDLGKALDEEEWVPDSDNSETEDEVSEESFEGERPWQKQPKYIVEHSQLQKLLEVCPMCAGPSAVELVDRRGAYIRYITRCSTCNHTRTWSNSDKAVRSVTAEMLEEVHQEHREKSIGVSGDACFHSIGHSATYSFYTLMNNSSSKIVACELLKCTETSSSPAMELEGLKRCRAYLEEKNLHVAELTTDRHSSLMKYMSTQWSTVSHTFDSWHLTKNLRKRLTTLANSKVAYRILLDWIPAVINHMYHVISHTQSGQLRKEWWCSTVNHICDIHVHTYETFPECQHEQAEDVFDEEGNKLEVAYLDCQLHADLIQLFSDTIFNFSSAINRASTVSTSELESFHSSLNRNAPKREGFSFAGMLSRGQLTLLHHNENCQRPVMLDKTSNPVKVVARSKATKLRPNYLNKLFHQLRLSIVDAEGIPHDVEPPSLASTGPSYRSIDEVEEAARQRKRGVYVKPHYLSLAELELAKRRAIRGKKKATT
ncbi:uncharacterized protein [Watersipora subatra]|uniref:uncharacterized protein n=1 Tax=Watersipora subatra TaxID=2589382 RepID=UPI00355BC94F